MLRIAHILGKTENSACERMITELYRAIDREKVQFDFFLCKGSEYLPAEEIKALGGRIFVLPSPKRRARYRQVLTELLKDNGYSVIQCIGGRLDGDSLKAAEKAGVPVRILYSCGGKVKSKLATHLLADCENAARKSFGAIPVCALNEAAPPVRIARILPVPADTEALSFSAEKRARARKALGIPISMKVFGHVGELNRQKEQSFLMDTFKQLLNQHQNSVLVLYGTGKSTDYIQARAIALGCMSKVVFADKRCEYNDLFSALDCLLITSGQAELPCAAVSAQGAGLYCLISDKLPHETKFTDSVQTLSLKCSAEDWACAALCCTDLRNKKAAKQTAAAGRDIRTVAAELEKYYTSLL